MIKNFILLFVKGLLMGVADVIPGISGGTIALIIDIYTHPIHYLSQLSGFFVLLVAGQFRPALKKVDFAFFVPLGFGLVFLLEGASYIDDTASQALAKKLEVEDRLIPTSIFTLFLFRKNI